MQPKRAADEGSAFRDFVRLAWRRKWFIAVPLVVLPCLAAGYSATQDKLYQASSEVLLTRDNPAVRLTRRPDPAASIQPDRIVQTQAQLARVPAVTLRVLEAAHVKGLTNKEFLEQSSVVANPNSDLLEFQVRNPGPARAKQLATEYGRQFSHYRRDLYERILANTAEGLEQRIAGLESTGKGKSALAANLRERLHRVETVSALQTSDAILVHRADDATQIQPKPLRLIAVGAALGLLLGLGLALIRNALDSRVHTASAMGGLLGVPLLARIAKPSRQTRRSSPPIVMLSDAEGEEAEPYRALRANVELALLAAPARSIMITSAVDAEGKSTTIANLAVALARAGRAVVLADFDLRRPKLGELFGLDDGRGIADVARGTASIDEVVARIPIDDGEGAIVDRRANGHPHRGGSLEVVPAGRDSLDVGELAGSGVLDDILGALGQRADLVLADAAPLLSGGEALALSAHVDAVVAVAKIQVARTPVLEDLRSALNASPARLLGFVLTGAEGEEGYSTRYYVRAGADRRPQHTEVA